MTENKIQQCNCKNCRCDAILFLTPKQRQEYQLYLNAVVREMADSTNEINHNPISANKNPDTINS